MKMKISCIKEMYEKLFPSTRPNVTLRLVGFTSKVLDVGCGEGVPLCKACKRPNAYRVGLDVRLTVLLKAREVYDDVVLADATHLP